MKTRSSHLLICALAASLWLPLASAAPPQAHDAPAPAVQDEKPEPAAAPNAAAAPDESKPAADSEHVDADVESSNDTDFEDHHEHHIHHHGDNARVHIGNNVLLGANETADNLVAVFGSTTSAGTVDENVVSVFGDTHVTGSVGENAVAVFGSTYIDSHVRGDAVAVFGDLEIGPNAIVDGEVTVVGGELKRAPTAVLAHEPNEVSLGIFGKGTGLRVWVEKCLLYLRPLAFAPGLGWAWIVAFAFLAFYALIALMFERPIEECVRTLETKPAQSIGIAFLSLLLTPFLFILICVTVVGIALIPFILLAMFCGVLFGKAVVFATIGRRLTRYVPAGPMSHIAAATIVGGLVAMLLYCIPVFGLIIFKVFGILGLGVLIYTIFLTSQARKVAQAPAADGAATAQTIETSDTVSDASTPRPESAQPEIAQPETAQSAATLERANFWIRMAALFIDTVLIAVISHIAHINDGFFLLLATYAAIMWKLKGTTVGGTICNLRLARLDGRSIDWSTAIVRALSCFLSMAFLFLGFFWIAFDRDRQAWHDKIAGTVVVRVPRGTASLV